MSESNWEMLNVRPNLIAFVLCLFVSSSLWAQGPRVTPEFLPGLASDGRDPVAAMVQAEDGNLYGSTREGGVNDHGTLYRVTPGAKSSASTIYSFDEETYSPDAAMVAASDGNLYGLTSVWKKLYRLTPGPAPVVSLFPFSFAGSDAANDTLVPARDGALYGTLYGNADNAGGIYRVTLGAKPVATRVWTFEGSRCSKETLEESARRYDNVPNNIHINFIAPDCRTHHSKLVAASDGNLYGMFGRGREVLYRVIPGEHPRAEILFTDVARGKMRSPLVAAKDGNLYGIMEDFESELVTVFVIKPGPKPVMTTVMSIQLPEFRKAKLVVAGEDGRLYGISDGGAMGCGSVFMLTPGAVPEIKTLLSFTSEQKDEDCEYNGAQATLAAGADGALYGTLIPTRFVTDDSDAQGSIFRVNMGATPSAAKILPFTRQLGYEPHAPLVAASDGNIYGTASKGAVHGDGSIFQLAPGTSELKLLFSFDSQTRANPRSALTAGVDGALYGGAHTCCGSAGVVYKVDTGAAPYVSTFYSFHSNSSAGGPEGSLVPGTDGYLYGLAPEGGKKSSWGSIYRVKPGKSPGAETLYEFSPESGVIKPNSPLIAARNGRFYGTTSEGGAFGMGAIFELTPGAAKPVSLVYSFNKDSGWAFDLTLGPDGRLYGVTYNSMHGCGTIYRLAPGKAGNPEILHTFDADSCWLAGRSGLVAEDGAIYLATTGNSSDDDGKIFKITTGDRASVAVVGSFSDGNRFGNTMLLAGGDHRVYGLAFGHGYDSGGELFQINPSAKPSINTLFTIDKTLRPNSMVMGKDGYFYGVSEKGGAYGLGALLRYKPGSGAIDLLYSFSDKADGAYPSTPLKLHSDGFFYGMTLQSSTRSNGRASLGRVYRFRPPP